MRQPQLFLLHLSPKTGIISMIVGTDVETVGLDGLLFCPVNNIMLLLKGVEETNAIVLGKGTGNSYRDSFIRLCPCGNGYKMLDQ